MTMQQHDVDVCMTTLVLCSTIWQALAKLDAEIDCSSHSYVHRLPCHSLHWQGHARVPAARVGPQGKLPSRMHLLLELVTSLTGVAATLPGLRRMQSLCKPA